MTELLEIRKESKLKFKGGSKKAGTYLLSGIEIFFCGYCKGPVKASVTIKEAKKDRIEKERILYYLCSRKQMTGNSTCQESRLHRQSFIDRRVINELKFLSEKIKYIDVPTLINKYILEQKEKMLAEAKIVTEQFSKPSNKFDPEAALSDLQNVQGSLSNIWAETSKLKLPSEYRNDSPQESIKENIRKLFLYNEKLEVQYFYPINEAMDFTDTWDLNDNYFEDPDKEEGNRFLPS